MTNPFENDNYKYKVLINEGASILFGLSFLMYLLGGMSYMKKLAGMIAYNMLKITGQI